MNDLPNCIHRGAVTGDLVACASNRLIHRGNVPLSLCEECRYADMINLDMATIRVNQTPEPKGLGDRIEQALTTLGITKERVEAFVGKPCGCTERKEKFNRLGQWLLSFLGGKEPVAARQELEEIVGSQK